jgi:fatty-acyl-CoA synthase
VLFGALPLFHVSALIVTVQGPLLRGQHVVWAGPLGYREPALYGVIWKIFEHHRVATLSAVPTVYSVLAQVPVDADLSALRFGVVGAPRCRQPSGRRSRTARAYRSVRGTA